MTATGLATASYIASLSEALGLVTLGDLIRHYPRRYEDRTHFKPIAQIRTGEDITICGRIESVANTPTRSRMAITKVLVRDDSGVAVLVFFNQWFLKKQFEKLIGRQMVAYGKSSRLGNRLELTEVEWELVEEAGDALGANRIVPIYPLAEGVKQARLRRLICDALPLVSDLVPDLLPEELRRRQGLISSAESIRQIHFPDNLTELDNARRRLTFDEFFAYQLVLAQRRGEARAERGITFGDGASAVVELKAALPFQLTVAQERVIEEIRGDMESGHPMKRLVQGDVGSGKTVVAMASLLIAVRAGYQAAIMAPTEILAEQHFNGIKRVMQQLDIPVALITGSLRGAAKADLLQCIEDGIYPIVVGTHSLIQDNVTFKRLGLAVIDEQHRFGVLQRAALREKGMAGSAASPDVLAMTATPIPRTLTLTVYGDLDVSIVDELPPGRKAIKTHWKRSEDRPLVYDTIRRLLAQQRQAYVICPLIAESEKLQTRAATELAEELTSEVFPEYRIGLLHGQMKGVEKDAIMDRFRERAIDLLVSTTVIEVGVDVPNASIIVIEDADRFGLAQLHQLRGRVGRGETQSYCLLIADPKTVDGAARMTVIERSTDGFEIAEEDLKLRGPGDFYGTRQSGVEMLPFMDVVRDIPVLHDAREEALAMIADDPELRRPEHIGLRAMAAAKRKLLSPIGGTN